MTRDPNAPEPLASSAADSELRALLEAGRDELPSEAQLGALAAKLGPILGPGGPGGGQGGAGGAPVATAAKKATGGALAKVLGAATLAIVLGGAAVQAVRGRAQTESPPVDRAASTTTLVAPAPSAGPLDDAPTLPPPSPLPIARPSAPPRPSVSAARPATSASGADDPDAEVKLLQRAQGSLQTDPAQTLSLCAEHARRFPSGLMAQEREVLAIEALVQTGHADDARARADRFAASYPSSTHLRRIHTVLGDAP